MAEIKTLSIDLETYSGTDIGCGVYKYASSPDFEILLFAFSVNRGPVQVVDVACGEEIPDEIVKAVESADVVKWAFNAQFERICLSAWLGYPVGEYLDPSSWRCSMIWSAYIGLPQSLAGCGMALNLEKQKMGEGKSLIGYFSVPCKPTKTNGGRTRNLPSDAPDKWETFKAYNLRDVETEMEIQEKLSKFPVPEQVWEEYAIDQRINDRGVLADMVMVDAAVEMNERVGRELKDRLQELTELDNPNSVQQMKEWLASQGLKMDSLGKKLVEEQLKTAPPLLREVLTLRQQSSKSSVSKYERIQQSVCEDGRIRGMFRFYGANRSGRFSSKVVQLHNLPQNHLKDLAEARQLVRNGDYEMVRMLYGNVRGVLSELIRTSLVAGEGKIFYISDYAAVEARVLAWLSGEEWRMQAFQDGKDIYCASASQMFHVPVEKHGVNGHLRQKGKIAELALGYGGSVGALKSMGALEMGLEEEELPGLVEAWRGANTNIVKYWSAIEHAALHCISKKTTATVGCIKMRREKGMFIITLPSGRELFYPKPKIGTNRFGSTSITYEGGTQESNWRRIESYGAKLVENITQAVSRDLLCNAMRELQEFDIVAHVHDELIIEGPPELSLDEICERMGKTPSWADGLILRADGFTSEFYRKD